MTIKYFKPKSLTWWASASPLFAGLFLALEPVHGLFTATQVLTEATGGMTAAQLINAGLFGIGLRGAL